MPSPYNEARLRQRALMGRIGNDVGAQIARSMDEFAKNITAKLRTIKSPQSARALRELRRVIRAQRELLVAGHTRAIVAGRSFSFRESLKIWDRGGREFAKLKGLSDIEISAIRPISISMQGVFENLNPVATWKTVLRVGTANAVEEAQHIMRAALLEGVDPDELARRMRKYMNGAEPFQKMFSEVPTLTGTAQKINLRGSVPAHLRGAARKMKFNATRVAFSEIHNARAEAEIQHFVEDPFVESVRWRLSPNRGTLREPDECDMLAEQDAYGLGKGVYPVTAVPSVPHALDRCERDPVTRATSEIEKLKPNPKLQMDPRDKKTTFPRARRLTARAQERARKNAWEAMKVGGAKLPPPLPPKVPAAGGAAGLRGERLHTSWKKILKKEKIGRGSFRSAHERRVPLEAMRSARKELFVSELISEFGLSRGAASRVFNEWNRVGNAWAVGSSTKNAATIKHLAGREWGAKTIYHKGFLDSVASLQQEFVTFAEEQTAQLLRLVRGKEKLPDDILQWLLRLDQEISQNVYRALEMKTITVYRGVEGAYFEANGLTAPATGHTGRMASNSLSSWSTDRAIAEGFTDARGVVFQMEVPVKDVLWNFQSNSTLLKGEREVVLIGRVRDYKVTRGPRF